MPKLDIALNFPGCHRHGGVERIVYECSRYLVGKGHRVTIYAQEWEPLPHPDISYQLIRSSPSAWLNPTLYYRGLKSALSSHHHDLIVGFGAECIGDIIWTSSVHRAWISSDLNWMTHTARRLHPKHQIILKMEKRLFTQGDWSKLIVSTQAVAADLNRLYGVDFGKTEVVPNGVNFQEFDPVQYQWMGNRIRRHLSIPEGGVIALFVGYDAERKGLPTMLQAASTIKEKRLYLIAVGLRNIRQYRLLADQLGIGNRFIALAPISPITPYYAAADFFLLPTRYEAMCLAILEALAMGLPVITSNIPGAKEAITHLENGLLISDPRSVAEVVGTIRILLDDEIRHRMQANARRSIANWSWDQVFRDAEQIFITTIQERSACTYLEGST